MPTTLAPHFLPRSATFASEWNAFSARFRGDSPVHTMLTPAECEVMLQICSGLSNKEIASVLGKSPMTVKRQVASILNKFGQPTRLRLVAFLHHPDRNHR